ALDVPWLQPFPDARVDTGLQTDIRLALVAALQVLPARQRAVLILRDVLEFSAAEVAAQLATTVAAVNSALQRARAALSDLGDVETISEPPHRELRAVVDRYLRAFEAADVPALVTLLTDEVVLEMPPLPLWYRGRRDYGRFMRRVFEMRGGGWATRLLTANGQPAFAAYAPHVDDQLRVHTLQVLTVTGGRVAANVVFADRRIFEVFGLARELPVNEVGTPR
ncbi:MAG TPA: sigma factor-like helix-turn-helix DNA-binding protein, partial [Acidimicrobiales bacterium]